MQASLEQTDDPNTLLWDSVKLAGANIHIAKLHWRNENFELAVKPAGSGVVVLQNTRVARMFEDPQNQWAYHKLGECYAELGLAALKLGLDLEEEACAALRRGMEFLPLAGDTDWDAMLLCLNGCSSVLSVDEARCAFLHFKVNRLCALLCMVEFCPTFSSPWLYMEEIGQCVSGAYAYRIPSLLLGRGP